MSQFVSLNSTSWATILSTCGLVKLKEAAYCWVASPLRKGMPRLGTDRTSGSDSVRYGDPVYFGRFGFGSDSVGSYRTYAESGARASGKNISNFDVTIY